MKRLARILTLAAVTGAAVATGITTAQPASAAVNVGYYDTCLGQGNANQVAGITAAGQTPVNVVTPDAATLASLAVLVVQNNNGCSTAAEYQANFGAITTAVSGGMDLVVFDRDVRPDRLAPGASSFNAVQSFSTNIDVLDNTTQVTNGTGPGGAIGNTTLDNGNYSNHGYVPVANLPAGSTNILDNGNATQIVHVCYGQTAGTVNYSTVPLDYYLAGNGPNPPRDNFKNIYYPNVVAYAAAGACNTAVATTTTVTGTPNPSTFGQAVTLTATVCATTGTAAPTGSVAFSEGATNFGSAPLSPSTGACATASKTLAGSQLTPGAHTITATYTPDTTAFGASSGNYTQNVGCTQNISGSAGNVVVNSGAACIQNANVAGSVTVSNGASLFVTNSTIGGTLTSNGGNTIRVCSSTVKGSTSISNSTGFVLLGSDTAACPTNTFANVTLNNNNGGLRIGGNTINGTLQVTNNHATGIDPTTGTASGNIVRHNTISGGLACSGNTPPASNEGASNNVSGPRSGECVGTF